METLLLKEKIDHLPEDLREQVADYVDFLLYRYGNDLPSLTTKEKKQLDERWNAYQQGSLSTSDPEEVKARLNKKYGVSN